AATEVSIQVHADHAAPRRELAATEQAKLAYAPDWMFNLALKMPLREIAESIEKDGSAGTMTALWNGDPREGWTEEERRNGEAWDQYNAARPMTDPDAAAKAYLGGG